ncbi:MAG: hypothetical protein COA69_05055 [Robiginitomaculum sp.]|nr:MAG: hypothetical protein COA69_05055 [Robiginitomaculum sp.]
MKLSSLLLVGVALWFSGCASYSDTTTSQQLSSDMYRISMRGSTYNESSDAQDFTLLKAAEITIDAGDRYFSIINSQDQTRTSSYTTNGSSESHTTANASMFGNYITGTANTTTSYTPGQTHFYIKPGADVLIQTYVDKPDGNSFDAQEVIKYLGQLYNPERWGEPADGPVKRVTTKAMLGKLFSN